MSDTTKRRKVRVMRIRRAFEMLARYYLDTTEARFLLDIDDPHAHKEFEAMQTMAKQLWMLMPDELEKAIQAYMDRRESENGKGKNEELWRHVYSRGSATHTQEPVLMSTLMSAEYVKMLSQKVYTIANGDAPVPNSANFPLYESALHGWTTDANVLTEPPYVAVTSSRPISIARIMPHKQIAVVFDDANDWTMVSMTILLSDEENTVISYRSFSLLDLMRLFYIDPRSIEDR